MDNNIPNINIEGKPEHVLTNYQVHTIAVVGEGALGINATKLKSNDDKEVVGLKEKIEKAKALDAEVKPEVVEAVEDTTPTEDTPATPDVEDADVSDEPTEDTDNDPTEDTDNDPVVEDADLETEKVDEDEDKAQPEETSSEEEPEGQTVKAKTYTTDEYAAATRTTVDGISKLVNDIRSAAPNANAWEVFDLIWQHSDQLTDVLWNEDEAKQAQVFDEVLAEVNSRTERAKALKVQESGTVEDKTKALELLHPELAVLVRESRAKTLELEAEAKAAVRAKRIEAANQDFKRISTDDNTTSQIVDALIEIEGSCSEATVRSVAKALEVAGTITMAADCFPDVAVTGETLVQQSADEYLVEKAKALVAEQGGELAAARSIIRSTSEYKALL